MEKFNSDFFDWTGRLRERRITEHGTVNQKEAFNGEIYTSYLITLCKLCRKETGLETSGYGKFVIDLWAFYEETVEKSRSHDDYLGLVCAGIKLKWLEVSRTIYRSEFILFLISRHKLLAIFGIIHALILPFKLIWSCAFSNKTKHGDISTDGELFAFNICENYLIFYPVKLICYFFLKKRFGIRWRTRLFELKFSGNKFTTNEDHPCRIMSRKLDELLFGEIW